MWKVFSVVCFGLFVLLVSSNVVRAQRCVLRIGAWESYPERKVEGGWLTERKATVTGFTSTATNQKSQRLYKGVSLMGYVYYESIPEGIYKITVRKAGFKTTIQSVKFTCEHAQAGIEFEDILIFRGSPKETVVRDEPLRLNTKTMRGSSDSDTGAPMSARKTISGGVLNGKAISLPKPVFPAAARAVRASGTVTVGVLIDEKGEVISAKVVGGSYIDMNSEIMKDGAHPLLVSASEEAARQAKFSPTLLDGQPVKVSGIITYRFVP